MSWMTSPYIFYIKMSWYIIIIFEKTLLPRTEAKLSGDNFSEKNYVTNLLLDLKIQNFSPIRMCLEIDFFWLFGLWKMCESEIFHLIDFLCEIFFRFSGLIGDKILWNFEWSRQWVIFSSACPSSIKIYDVILTSKKKFMANLLLII